MVKHVNILDKLHVQKYLYLITMFLSEQIDVDNFEKLFLEVRRTDSYWQTGCFNEDIDRVLNSIFLDVDEYAPDELLDTKSNFDINESELRNRIAQKSERLNELTN